VQVINTVTAIVNHLPPDVFETADLDSMSQDGFDISSSDLGAPPPANAQETARNNIIREMVETERKYVQDLEIMQVCSRLV
jgi:cell division control protein 24